MNLLKNRLLIFDYQKGFLIILVVLGHTISSSSTIVGLDYWQNPLYNFIYTFHMPMFIFISSLFFKSSIRKSICEVFVSKFVRLVIPTFIFSTVLLALWFVLEKENRIPTMGQLWGIYVTYWFTICLFFLCLIYWCFYNSNNTMKILLGGAFLIAIVFYNQIPSKLLKDCQIVRQTLIFGIGTCISIQFIKTYICSKYSFLLLILSVLGVIFNRFYFGFNMMEYNIVIRILDQLFCTTIIFVISYLMFNKMSQHDDYISKSIVWLGQNSLGIYMLHMLILVVMAKCDIMLPFSWCNMIVDFVLLFSSTFILQIFFKTIFKKKSYILGI